MSEEFPEKIIKRKIGKFEFDSYDTHGKIRYVIPEEYRSGYHAKLIMEEIKSYFESKGIRIEDCRVPIGEDPEIDRHLIISDVSKPVNYSIGTYPRRIPYYLILYKDDVGDVFEFKDLVKLVENCLEQIDLSDVEFVSRRIY